MKDENKLAELIMIRGFFNIYLQAEAKKTEFIISRRVLNKDINKLLKSSNNQHIEMKISIEPSEEMRGYMRLSEHFQTLRKDYESNEKTIKRIETRLQAAINRINKSNNNKSDKN